MKPMIVEDNCDYIKAKIKELEAAVLAKDNESVHGFYDDIMRHIAEKYDPELVRIINEKTKGINFWYSYNLC